MWSLLKSQFLFDFDVILRIRFRCRVKLLLAPFFHATLHSQWKGPNDTRARVYGATIEEDFA